MYWHVEELYRKKKKLKQDCELRQTFFFYFFFKSKICHIKKLFNQTHHHVPQKKYKSYKFLTKQQPIGRTRQTNKKKS